MRSPPRPPLFPYTTLFRSPRGAQDAAVPADSGAVAPRAVSGGRRMEPRLHEPAGGRRSEEHTSELQSLRHLVCRLLLEKKKNAQTGHDEGVAVGTQVAATT